MYNAIDYAGVEQMIRDYYRIRGLKWPTVEQAMMWAASELGEAFDELLKRGGPWVRNNAAKQAPFDVQSFFEECGDTIFMLIVASLVIYDTDSGNALKAMVDKIERKITAEIHREV